MSSGSVSGAYRPVDPGSIEGPEEEAAPSQAAQDTGRGVPARAAPATAGFSGDPGASILQAQLDEIDLEAAAIEDQQAALIDQAMSADSPATVDAALDRMDELQARLDELYQERDDLEAMLDDPDADAFDMIWTEWDLADVDLEIADVEHQLGKLEDSLWKQLTETAFDLLDMWGDMYSTMTAVRTSESFTKGTDSRRDDQFLAQLKQRKELTKRVDAEREATSRERAERDGVRKSDGPSRADRPEGAPRTPETTRLVMKALERMRSLERSEAGFKALRAEMKKLEEAVRGKRA